MFFDARDIFVEKSRNIWYNYETVSNASIP